MAKVSIRRFYSESINLNLLLNYHIKMEHNEDYDKYGSPYPETVNRLYQNTPEQYQSLVVKYAKRLLALMPPEPEYILTSKTCLTSATCKVRVCEKRTVAINKNIQIGITYGPTGIEYGVNKPAFEVPCYYDKVVSNIRSKLIKLDDGIKISNPADIFTDALAVIEFHQKVELKTPYRKLKFDTLVGAAIEQYILKLESA